MEFFERLIEFYRGIYSQECQLISDQEEQTDEANAETSEESTAEDNQ